MRRIGHDPRMKRASWILTFVSACLAGCGSLRAPRVQAVPTPPAAAVQDPLDSIARLEDMRTDGDGLLQVFAARGEVRTRVRAVRALGRLPRDEYGAPASDALVDALEDDDTAVRSAAAFALGMRADPATVGALNAAAQEGSVELRARCIEALSRIDDARARRAVIDALGAQSPIVARTAALGIHRFPKTAPEAAVAEAELVKLLASGSSAAAVADETRWRALSTLARREVVGARTEFERGAVSPDARVRLFALQGLGAIPTDARASSILCAGLADADWRVACEAAQALGKHANPGAVAALREATARALPPNAAHHVRRSAFEALGRIASAADVARPDLERARSDDSASVRAAAIEAGARLYRDASLSALETASRDTSAVVRAGAAAATAHLTTDAALTLLDRLVLDADLRVATTAVDALAEHIDDPRARERIRGLLAAKDNGLRLAAATALKTQATAEDLALLELALSSTRGEIAPEVAAAIVAAAAHVGGEDALALLTFAIAYPDPYVARKARAAALVIRPDARLPRAAAPSRRSNVLPPVNSGPNPRVALETSRGTLVLELLADEAPFHVANFLELAQRGHYDGTKFHRVVPDFVVQGGDVRGDGNGGTTWRGDALRAEFGPRAYSRGSLGMPRNDDPDSGGSQIFLTHRETPHLDGRYTLFGETIEGLEVLDALQVGDTILRVRVMAAEG